MKHELTTIECTVDHKIWIDENDKGEPCRECKYCRKFVRPYLPFIDEECPARKDEKVDGTISD